jgi:acyl carrier protein
LSKDDIIKGLVKKHFCVEVLGNKTRFKEDLAADSLAIMELVMDLEDTFDILIPENDIRDGKFTTVGELISYINEMVPVENIKWRKIKG